MIGGLRCRLEVAHVKLAASRVFWLVAYPAQSHGMLFDAHTRAFVAFGGVPRRGLYDNMKTAVDRIGRSRERTVNARFQALCSHYLFEPEFCNRAAGWEKGILEKNVQDRRRQLWVEAGTRHWPSLEALNDWLAIECKAAWEMMMHPDCPVLTLADAVAGGVRWLCRTSGASVFDRADPIPAQPLQRALRVRARTGQPAGVTVRAGGRGRRSRSGASSSLLRTRPDPLRLAALHRGRST